MWNRVFGSGIRSGTGRPVNPRTRLDRFADFIVKFVPDAITASVILLLLLAVFALALGNPPLQLIDAYYKGFWSLLPFTSQMTLTIVLGAALASSPVFQTAVGALSRLPRTASQMVALAVLLTAVASYCFWGLGYASEVGRAPLRVAATGQPEVSRSGCRGSRRRPSSP